MKPTNGKHLLAGVLVSVLTVAGLSVTAAPASAAVNKLVASQGQTGNITISQGAVLHAGQVVSVELSSSFPPGDLEIMELAPGVTMTQVDAKINEAGQGGPTAAAAMQWFAGTNTAPAKTRFYGGLPFAGQNKFDLILPPGTYYITQLRPSGNVTPSTAAKQFKVIGTPQATQPYAGQKITVVNTNGPDLFSAYSVNAGNGKLQNGTVTLANKTGSITSPRELHFIQFWPVPVGTTPQQACASVQPGGYSFGTMSSQRAVRAHLNVPLGWYWVTSWIPDTNSGTPHALECEGTLVEVVA